MRSGMIYEFWIAPLVRWTVDGRTPRSSVEGQHGCRVRRGVGVATVIESLLHRSFGRLLKDIKSYCPEEQCHVKTVVCMTVQCKSYLDLPVAVT